MIRTVFAMLALLALLFSSFLTFPSNVFSSTIDNILQKKESAEWRYFFVSEPFNAKNNDSSENETVKLFDGKKIIFNGQSLTITNACAYKYAAQVNTPLSFWGSFKTVRFYKEFFSNYKVEVPNKFLDVTPVNPLETCDFPFSEFIVLGDELVFFYKNHAVLYFKTLEALKSHEKENIRNDPSVKQGLMGISKNCKEIERNPDNYDTSQECFYNNLDLIEAYKAYREGLLKDSKKYLQDTIISNKDFSMKCDNGCITVIYKWHGPNNLVITQQFDGGETEISFSKEVQGCRVVTKSFPD